MKNRTIGLMAMLILSLLIITPAHAQSVNYLTTDEFKEHIFDFTTGSEWKYKGSVPCIIDFYTTWCGPCKRLAPIMEELAEQYCDQINFYKVDTEKERTLAYLFQINSIPQVLYVPLEGRPTLLKGLYPKENIQQIIDEILLPKKADAINNTTK